MLVCKGCGAMLVSDGQYWKCPQRYNHPTKDTPTQIQDRRITLQKEVEHK